MDFLMPYWELALWKNMADSLSGRRILWEHCCVSNPSECHKQVAYCCYQSQGEVRGEFRLQCSSHGSQGLAGGTPWTTVSLGSERSRMRRSDQRSGLLWPLMFDEPGLTEMHRRWRRTPGGSRVPDYPSYCLVITDQPRVTTDARTGPMIEPWQWL